jgi:exopolysaccharide biosynthesis protein
MRVEISRFYQASGQIEWFEAYVIYRDGGKPFSVESKRDGAALESPLTLAEEAGAVFAINDDFYRYRVNAGERTGIVVRDGKVKADRTYPQDRSRIPSLEVLALFGAGKMQAFASDAFTGAEYVAMGVTDTWAFGPALTQGGEVPRYFYSDDYRTYREPRCALGMVRPGEYCALVVTGRKDGSRGATFGWMAEKMLAMGAIEALNLDGGGTTALVFQGELLNHAVEHQDSRAVSGLIAFK